MFIGAILYIASFQIFVSWKMLTNWHFCFVFFVRVITDMGSDRYCLRWNNHQNNLLGVFSQLLQEESLVDVTLACSEGHSIRAHKVVLSACSSYFRSLFLDHPNRHPIIILKDVCFAELRTLIEFMYRGEVNLEYCQLPTFLKTAKSLQVKGLTEMTHLRSSLTPDRDLMEEGGEEREDGQSPPPQPQPQAPRREQMKQHQQSSPPPPPPSTVITSAASVANVLAATTTAAAVTSPSSPPQRSSSSSSSPSPSLPSPSPSTPTPPPPPSSHEPLPLIRRRSSTPTGDTEASTAEGIVATAATIADTTLQPSQFSPSVTSSPLSPTRSINNAAAATYETCQQRSSPPPPHPPPHPALSSNRLPMSVSPHPPDTSSICEDDCSMTPEPDEDDDVSSIQSGPSDMTIGSQIPSPPYLKAIPGPSSLPPVQQVPLVSASFSFVRFYIYLNFYLRLLLLLFYFYLFSPFFFFFFFFFSCPFFLSCRIQRRLYYMFLRFLPFFLSLFFTQKFDVCFFAHFCIAILLPPLFSTFLISFKQGAPGPISQSVLIVILSFLKPSLNWNLF